MVEQLNGNNGEKPSPVQRTEDLFSQDVGPLALALQGRLVVSQEDGKIIRIDRVEAWLKDLVGNRYLKSQKNLRLTEMACGMLGVFPLPVRRMSQSLISAKDGGEPGACVRLLRASKFDRDSRRFVEMPREGDIANYFGLEDNEAVQLRFVDDSEILYFARGSHGKEVQVEPMPLSPDERSDAEKASRYLRDLIEG